MPDPNYERMCSLSRRSFLKYCAGLASLLSLPATAIPLIAEKLAQKNKPPVIWLSFQECTGCTESFTRSYAPTIESLIFNFLSLDYHHTLQAASGEAAEAARLDTIRNHKDHYLLVVDGSIPVKDNGVYSTIAGVTNLHMLKEAVNSARAVVAVGSCAAFGGLPAARPDPTGAMSVSQLMEDRTLKQKPLVNIPGCPPLADAISAVLAHYLTFQRFPELDNLQRPLSFYGHTVHDRCSRLSYYEDEKFAESFDDKGAREGWCLYKLGCRGPVTHNACASVKWNNATSFPIEAGHPCLGCSEPDFWDRGDFYTDLDHLAVASKSAASAQQGQQIYESHCVYCHSINASEFSASADEIVRLLKDGNIRSHRGIELDNAQTESLREFFLRLKR